MVARSTVRRRWRVVVAVGLLFGLVGGIGIGCLAGARRTSTLFQRHLVASDGPDLEIDPGAVTPAADRALRGLPGVRGAAYWAIYGAFVLKPDGTIDRRLADALTFTTDGRYLDTDRVALAQGRRLDPAKPGEIMVNESWAEFTGLGVGSHLRIGTYAVDDDRVPTDPGHSLRTQEVEVVGIMVINEEITSEVLDTIPRMFVSPAFALGPAGRADLYGFSWYSLQLDPSVTAAETEATWNRLAAAHNQHLAEGEQPWLTNVHRSSDVARKSSRAMRPLVTTLAAFGMLALLAAVVLAAQSLGRTVRTGRDEVVIARILGLTPGQAFLVSMAVPAGALAVASVVGLATATTTSLAFPAGPFQVLEPTPGLDLDLRLVLPLLLAMIGVPLALVALTTGRLLRATALTAAERPRRPARIAVLVSRSSGSPSLTAAARLTFEPGAGRSFVPTRSVQVSIGVAVVALVTILVFGRNLTALDQDPTRFGWTTDAAVISDGGYSPFDGAKLRSFLAGHREITRWRVAATGQARIAGRVVPGAVFGPGDRRIQPTLLAGRAPARAGEIALGAATMRTVGGHVGGRVLVGTGRARRSMRITGTAVFPVMGPSLSVRTSLDEGVWFEGDDALQLDLVANAIGYGIPAGSVYTMVFADVRPGTSLARLDAAADRAGITLGSSTDVVGVIRPSEVRTAASASGRTQWMLAGVLALSAVASMVLALVTVVRRRQPELAIYRTLGFTPRQIRATLLWQGVILVAVGLIVGVPLGAALGRTLWRAFAVRLGVVPDPVLPGGLIGLAAAAAFVIAIAGAVGPAVVASRVPPAAGVRAE